MENIVENPFEDKMENPFEDKVEVFTSVGDKGKSWHIDRYKATVVISIVTVILLTVGIIWLASRGGENSTSASAAFPTGELKFNESPEVKGASTQQIPYPSVKNASPLNVQEDPSKTPSSTKTPTPTPTTKPSATSTPAPTPTPTPKPADPPAPTATPTPCATPTPITELKIEDITVGDGPAVKNNDTIRINYTGTLTNCTKFDSSYDRGTPFEAKIGVGQVIEGWDKGVIGMKVGGKRKLTIPADMAYGSTPQPGIPANSDLIFEMELLEIK